MDPWGFICQSEVDIYWLDCFFHDPGRECVLDGIGVKGMARNSMVYSLNEYESCSIIHLAPNIMEKSIYLVVYYISHQYKWLKWIILTLGECEATEGEYGIWKSQLGSTL